MAMMLPGGAGAESAHERVALEPHTTFQLAPHDSWEPTTLWAAHICSFLDPEQCRQLRQMADEHVATHGWELSRHKRFATTDL